MKIKKNDQIKVVAGNHKGKTGKVLAVLAAQQMVLVEGLGVFTRHFKPSQLHPQGGSKEIHRPIHVSNVALVVDKDKTARVGYELKKDNTKVRVARNRNNKEIQ